MKFKVTFIASLLLLLSACNAPPTASDTTLDVNLLPQSQTAQTAILAATDIDSTILTYSIVVPPLLGKVIITDTSTGAYRYQTSTGQTNADSDTFTFQVSDGVAADTADVTVNLKTDPLYQYQWHLDNTGQTNFALNGGTAGEDINLSPAINAGLSGSNVIAAVLDSGLEISHEDLSANIVVGGSRDFFGNDTNPTNPMTTGDHGTSVAGLIASRGWNNIGGRGVAPFASLKGFNVLRNQTLSNYVSALGGAGYSSDVAIFNQSYGSINNDDSLINPTMEEQYMSGVNTLRNNRGAIYVKSAGNGFESFSNLGVISCAQSRVRGLSCQNANMDATNTIPANIVIGALNAHGVKSIYSTAGSALWASAPGGEFGDDDPALLTTDQSSCSQGYVRSSVSSSNAFSNGARPIAENAQCNYTAKFNGSSSAAPITSGVVALILEANPNLTWRDVKHILATTSDQVDSGIANVNIDVNGVTYNAEPAWLTNAAGHKFHNYYGFGRINVGNAITAAQNYTLGSLGAFVTTPWMNSGNIAQAIPDNNALGTTHAINTANNLNLEAVQIRVNINHSFTGDLGIELTSPSGTRSVLFYPFNGFYATDDLTNMVLLSNAFYGENSSGNWTIRVLDASGSDTGTLRNWSIRFFGH